MASTYLPELQDYIDGIWVIDTHEHMPTEEQWLAEDPARLDFSQLMHYIDLDIVSAGMPSQDMWEVRFGTRSEDEKWTLFEPHWANARNTGFAKVIDMAVRDFYGLPGLNADTYREIGARIRETRKPGRYRHVLKEIARIQVSILDTGCASPDPELFVTAVRLDHFLEIATRQSLAELEKRLQVSISSLADLERELASAVQEAKAAGAAAIKTAQAYSRGLRYEHVEREAAALALNTLSTVRNPGQAGGVSGILFPKHAKVLSDYLFSKLVESCIDHDLPIQVHTGIAAGNAVRLEPTNPVFLTDIFLSYPEARLDLFHAGFPFWEELGVLVKTFANTRADLCWTHIISPAASRRALDEWLELAPANKIFGFGGDLGSVEIAAAHLKIARTNIAEVLAAKVDRGYFTLSEAKDVARMILHDNPAEFFRLG